MHVQRPPPSTAPPQPLRPLLRRHPLRPLSASNAPSPASSSASSAVSSSASSSAPSSASTAPSAAPSAASSAASSLRPLLRRRYFRGEVFWRENFLARNAATAAATAAAAAATAAAALRDAGENCRGATKRPTERASTPHARGVASRSAGGRATRRRSQARTGRGRRLLRLRRLEPVAFAADGPSYASSKQAGNSSSRRAPASLAAQRTSIGGTQLGLRLACRSRSSWPTGATRASHAVTPNKLRLKRTATPRRKSPASPPAREPVNWGVG